MRLVFSIQGPDSLSICKYIFVYKPCHGNIITQLFGLWIILNICFCLYALLLQWYAMFCFQLLCLSQWLSSIDQKQIKYYYGVLEL